VQNDLGLIFSPKNMEQLRWRWGKKPSLIVHCFYNFSMINPAEDFLDGGKAGK